MKRVLLVVLLLAAPAAAAGPACRDAGLLSGKLVTDICWACLFPIRVMGVSTGGGSAPDGAVGRPFCTCTDAAGVPQPGWVLGMWEPARLVELVRRPGCSPVLGGAELPAGAGRLQGHSGREEDADRNGSFYHYHYFAFPLLAMLDLANPGRCGDGFVDMDLMYLSELDPTWNHDELAFFTHPEAAAVANPLAVAACAAEAATAAAGQVLDRLWWCAGSWGTLYPFSGSQVSAGMVQDTSLLAVRALATLHRRGLARRTMGSEALCRSPIEPMLPKSQYKWTMVWPVAETRRAHVTGEPVVQWGLGRLLPGVGEDAVYLLWRWNDCCETAL